MNSLTSLGRSLQRTMGQHHVLASLIVSAVILGLSTLLVIMPKISELQEVGLDRRETRQAALANLQEELRTLTDARNRFEAITLEQYALLDRALPTKKDIPQLIVDIPAFIQAQGLSVGQMDVSETTYVASEGQSVNTTIRRVDVTVTVGGVDSYARMKTFLGALEDNLRIIDLSSVSYRPDTAAYSLVLTTYYTTARTSASAK